jgi:hypothetical protein
LRSSRARSIPTELLTWSKLLASFHKSLEAFSRILESTPDVLNPADLFMYGLSGWTLVLWLMNFFWVDRFSTGDRVNFVDFASLLASAVVQGPYGLELDVNVISLSL